MNNDNQRHSMKRRSFFSALGIGIAGAFASVPLLRSLVRFIPPTGNPGQKVVVKINPYAVPRTEKGNASHG
jgi:hypothetical protein